MARQIFTNTVKRIGKMIGCIGAAIVALVVLFGMVVICSEPFVTEIPKREFDASYKNLEVVDTFQLEKTKASLRNAVKMDMGTNVESDYVRIYDKDGETRLVYYWTDSEGKCWKARAQQGENGAPWIAAMIVTGKNVHDHIIGAHFEDNVLYVETTAYEYQ